MHGKEIHIFRDLRNCIDAIYDQNKWIMKLELLVFFFGFFVPLIFQMQNGTGVAGVIICNCICLVTRLAFFSLDAILINQQGPNYFLNASNCLDFGMVMVYLVYFGVRMINLDTKIIPMTDQEFQTDEIGVWVLFNSLITFTSILKMIGFLRVFEKFGIIM
jgi:hypothetical protein